jgi:hypothetical protein
MEKTKPKEEVIEFLSLDPKITQKEFEAFLTESKFEILIC